MNTFTEKTELYASFSGLWGDNFDLWIIRNTWDNQKGGVRRIAKPIEFSELPPQTFGFGANPDPTFSVTRDQAQQFMDELWRMGVRPTEGKGSAGQMAATERHLADLQKIVFKT